MTTAAIEFHGLECKFGGLRAVADLDMTIAKGKITALIGPNGAGKSTVINLLSGLLRPTEGRICFMGEDVTGSPPHLLAKGGLARTFQNGRLFRRLSAFENCLVGSSTRMKASLIDIVLHTSRYRLEERDIEERARTYLREFDLLGDADRLVTELPYGKQRQIEIVRALMGGPSVLLLDEPAAGLNTAEQTSLTSCLRKLCAAGLTILLIEHHMGIVMQLAEHVVVLNFGKKIFEGTTKETQNSPVVLEAYLGRKGGRHAGV